MRGGRFTIRSIHYLTGVLLLGCGITGCLRHWEPPGFTSDLLNLRLTEIHYNPADCGIIDGDSLEFIELKNVGSTALNLEGVEFIYGIDYAFPLGTRLQPDHFFVIASSRKSFETCYNAVPDGEYDGQLRNSADTIRVMHIGSGTMLINQSFADSGSWPGSADGDGYSLVPVKATPGNNETAVDFWRSSTILNGSPGADDIPKPFDSSLYDLRITEIHYHPLSAADSLGEDSLEFIELKNTGSKTIDLTDVEFTTGIDYRFAADATVEPGAFLVLASNAKWFKDRYGVDPFDVYDGQLRNSSETLTVEDVKAAVTLLSIGYSDRNPWPEKADGDGWSLVTINANPARDGQNNPAAWRQSFRVNGSPGNEDPGVVLVNEALPHTDTPQVDAIELYNPGDNPVNIGGWYLTDDHRNPIKYKIPDSTVIKAGDYKVFTANDFNKDTTAPTSFALSELGDEAYLVADETGCRGYCHGCSFGALENGISYGRYIIPSTGNEVFVPMKDITLGEANSGPLVGPLVISEIMFQSRDYKSDFIEVTNIGNKEVMLYNPNYPTDTWRMQIDDREFLFPAGKTIKSGESVVLFSSVTTVDDFKSTYGIPEEVQLFTFIGSLPDTSVVLELEKPVDPEKDITGAIISTTVEYMEYEKVSYNNRSPWPVGASGSSMTRISTTTFGNDPVNWKIVAPTPGKVE